MTPASRPPYRGFRRWLKSTSNRSFIVFPLVLFAIECALQRGGPYLPYLDWRGVPLLIWGYGQYRLVGNYRQQHGGGGPGLSIPPERLVLTGPYRYTRNPMYLGHLIFLAGLAWLLHSWLGVALLAFHVYWFHQRVKNDEPALLAQFGESYRQYQTQVKRWIPWVI